MSYSFGRYGPSAQPLSPLSLRSRLAFPLALFCFLLFFSQFLTIFMQFCEFTFCSLGPLVRFGGRTLCNLSKARFLGSSFVCQLKCGKRLLKRRDTAKYFVKCLSVFFSEGFLVGSTLLRNCQSCLVYDSMKHVRCNAIIENDES